MPEWRRAHLQDSCAGLSRKRQFVALEEDAPEKTHRQLRAEIRSEGLEEYIHVGPLHGRRFTLTVISDQACATARPHRRGSAIPAPRPTGGPR